MGMRLLSFLLILSIYSYLYAQNTYDQVYNIFQNSCAGYCHNGTSGAGGLDLTGSGSDPKGMVWSNLYNVVPTNSYADSEGYRRIYPGDPYRSSLFRKINHGLDDFVDLHPNEGDPMPPLALDDKDKELIRQWILFNSPKTGNVVDTALINEYYNGNGVDGITSRPTPPAASEGFQIKVGPFFLHANAEKEFFYKYNVANDQTIEVKEVFSDLGQTYSHHFIIFKFRMMSGAVDYGLRTNNAHNYITLITAHQQTENIPLPNGTCFEWEPNTILDLNSHYINYSNQVLKCENYANIYTQPNGTAIYKMHTGLYPYYGIYIPNDGQDYTFQDSVFDASLTNDLHVWSATSHTHQWGKDYDAWLRNPDGSKGEKFYDASNMGGEPNGVQIGYDYQHPPTRTWDYPFFTIPISEGFIHEGKYNNTGSAASQWGSTSGDEMMIMGLMYVLDTAGLGALSIQDKEPLSPVDAITIFPNPSNGAFNIRVNKMLENARIKLFDISGKLIAQQKLINGNPLQLRTGAKGIYFYTIEEDRVNIQNGKIISN